MYRICLVDGHFYCLRVLGTGNSAVMNIEVQVSFQIMIFFAYIPVVQFMYHRVA